MGELKYTLNWFAYVLECVNNKYYIGITYDLKRRLRKQLENKGSVFTKIYPPVKCIIAYDLQTESRDQAELYETILVIHWANKHGFDNVAGGVFVSRDPLERKRKIVGCIEKGKVQIHGKIFSISDIVLFDLIKECEIPDNSSGPAVYNLIRT